MIQSFIKQIKIMTAKSFKDLTPFYNRYKAIYILGDFSDQEYDYVDYEENGQPQYETVDGPFQIVWINNPYGTQNIAVVDWAGYFHFGYENTQNFLKARHLYIASLYVAIYTVGYKLKRKLKLVK